ncbi:MAG TPA: pantoate--beta-alanine ligase [Cellulomonas sp.]|uniref:pantoate--beta-alanine ligase n=1 Tax=Cellulomonas sp. TaxID=40001 RepID=UPI002E2F0A77|nr:pantoate--beta-alanine ligase [Cellulomonas sp.]HEX5331953.1 pantoate--beta-alanine ligase [Cellulomonas sp.]
MNAQDRLEAAGTPTLARTRDELAAALAVQGAHGLATAQPATGGRVGRLPARAVVMTMGALHAGHLALVAAAKASAQHVVVTIFVNPLQFGPDEDLDRYPRDLAGDLALLTGPGLLGAGDVVFAPTPDVVYADGDPVVRVSAGRFGEVLETVARPGHLDGVLTVVLKLLHLTRPDVAMFGQKDAQQVAAVRRMVRDLDVPVDVREVATVRDADGLALSSRNAYLSPAERTRALVLGRSVRAAHDAADGPGATPAHVRAAAHAVLAGADIELEYAELVDPATFEAVDDRFTGPAVLAVAARVGATRLIDNAWVMLGDPTAHPQTAPTTSAYTATERTEASR